MFKQKEELNFLPLMGVHSNCKNCKNCKKKKKHSKKPNGVLMTIAVVLKNSVSLLGLILLGDEFLHLEVSPLVSVVPSAGSPLSSLTRCSNLSLTPFHQPIHSALSSSSVIRCLLPHNKSPPNLVASTNGHLLSSWAWGSAEHFR